MDEWYFSLVIVITSLNLWVYQENMSIIGKYLNLQICCLF
jgi:hypothetical protein